MLNYILHVTTGSEAKAAEALQTLGLSVVCPMRPTPRRNPKNRRKVITVNVPVLPGYIVISSHTINWPAVRGVKHVIKPIDCGGEPQPVSADLVQYVADLEGVEATDLPFRLQQRVQILSDVGEPTGLYGTIAKMFGIKRANVELDQLGVATVSVDKLEAA